MRSLRAILPQVKKLRYNDEGVQNHIQVRRNRLFGGNLSVVLVASEGVHEVEQLAGSIASMGYTPLPLFSTENIIEDVTLNSVRLVILSDQLTPFSGNETCTMLRSDPGIDPSLPILLLADGRVDPRRLEKYGFTGTLNPEASTAEQAEEVIRLLGDYAAPDALNPLKSLGID